MEVETTEENKAQVMQAARLDVELHNRDNDDKWSIKE